LDERADGLDAYYYEKIQPKQCNIAKDIRGHGFQWRIKLPNIKFWNKRKEYMDSKDIIYIESRANWTGQRIKVRGYKVWLLDHSIILYLPKNKSFYSYSCEGSYQMALVDLMETLKCIESKMGINLKLDSGYHIMPSRQHYAKIKDALAEDYNNKKLNR
jgi:hypothetical protein